jgi:thiol-disulfide isomerase/thioredoxin
LPRLEELYKKYADKGFYIVAVEARRDTERARKFIAEKKLTFTMVENGKDDKEIVRKIFSARAFPTLFVVDKNNKVQYYYLGFEGDEKIHKLEEQIKTLLLKS